MLDGHRILVSDTWVSDRIWLVLLKWRIHSRFHTEILVSHCSKRSNSGRNLTSGSG